MQIENENTSRYLIFYTNRIFCANYCSMLIQLKQFVDAFQVKNLADSCIGRIQLKEGMKRNQKYINYLFCLQSFLPSSSILYPPQLFLSWVFFPVAYFPFLFFTPVLFPPSSCSVLPFFFYTLFLFFHSVISLSTTTVPTLSVLWLFILIQLQKSFVQF